MRYHLIITSNPNSEINRRLKEYHKEVIITKEERKIIGYGPTKITIRRPKK